ncbi:MAG: hypothetical protein DHS20C12_11750 [Pseudohongiella sp.]|nr:MAG: hypothetical protein DHS20C12_11750 [Pseudohongiella sp.]
MRDTNWSKVQPTSLTHAIQLCVSYAREKRNLSVVQISEYMGMSGPHSLYNYQGDGRMPAALIRPFEMACGCNYLSRYIAHSARLLTITIPTGRKATARDYNALQSTLNDAVKALLDFSDDKLESDECVASLTAAMEDLAWHRSNVEKNLQPELVLFSEGED